MGLTTREVAGLSAVDGPRSQGELLAAFQVADSALPSGRFAHSFGIESVLREDPGADLGRTVSGFLVDRVAPLDGVAIASIYGRADPYDVDRRLAELRSDGRWRRASQGCGQCLAMVAETLLDDEYCATVRRGETPGEQAAVHGVLSAALGIDVYDAVVIELRAIACAMLMASLRLGLRTPPQVQRQLATLESSFEEGAAKALEAKSMRYRGPMPSGNDTASSPRLFHT